jgi:hypothetical protein
VPGHQFGCHLDSFANSIRLRDSEGAVSVDQIEDTLDGSVATAAADVENSVLGLDGSSLSESAHPGHHHFQVRLSPFFHHPSMIYELHHHLM